jgi:hypothetical protein
LLNSKETRGLELNGATLGFVDNGMETLKKKLYLKFKGIIVHIVNKLYIGRTWKHID